MRSSSLDIIRIFAALAVLGVHLLNIEWGWVGVQIFFTLSGYLIASSNHTDWRKFVSARAKRLLPGAIACSVMTAVILGATGSLNGAWLFRMIGSAVLSPVGPWIDAVYWTLGMEMAFYGVVAYLIAKGASQKLETVMLMLASLSLSAWAVATMAGVYGPQIPGLPSRVIELSLMKDAIFFAAGVILWKARSDGWTNNRLIGIIFVAASGCLPIFMETLARDAGNAAIPIALWLSAVGIMAIPEDAPKSGRILATLSKATYPLYLCHHQAGGAMMAIGIPAWIVVPALIGIAIWITVVTEPAILRIGFLFRIPTRSTIR